MGLRENGQTGDKFLVTVATAGRRAHPMILCVECGLHFAKDGDHRRCVERPELVMLRGDRYEVEGREFDTTLAEAPAKSEPSAVDFLEHGEGDAALPLALVSGEALGLVYDFVDAIKDRITLAAMIDSGGPCLAEHRIGHVGLHRRSVRRCAQGLSAEA